AFPSVDRQIELFDGPLGAYCRRELELRGVRLFEKAAAGSRRQVITASKAIRNVDDVQGLRMRTATAPINVDFWKTIGASPTAVDANELYTALQTHLVDGSESPLEDIESRRYFEVQHYLSLTKHQTGGNWIGMNPAAWSALPSDIQAIVQ